MRSAGRSVGAWKLLLSAVALFVTGLLLTEFLHAPRTLAPGASGTLGMKYHQVPEWGRSRYVIDELARDSPLLEAGARVGDIWIPDRAYDADRHLEARERIGLTLISGVSSRHVVVETLPDKASAPVGTYLVSWFASLFCLVMGLLIGLRRADNVAWRAFSIWLLVAVAFHAFPGYRNLPAGTGALIYHLLWPTGRLLTFVVFLIFVLNFPDDRPRSTPLKRWLLRYVAPPYAVLAFAALAAATAHAAGYYVPLHGGLFAAVLIVIIAMALAVMLDNWRTSLGETRERHLWILLSFAVLAGMQPLVMVLTMRAEDAGTSMAAWTVVRTAVLLSVFTFSYAVLRHRVVSIGFAVNRVMVYSAASIGMLLSFGIIEWLAHHLLDFAGREKSVLLDGAIALGIFLVFHRLRHWGDELIERLFFHSWHAKEQALRKFVNEAPFITRPEALLNAFTSALDRFTDGAGHAVYRRSAGGDYQRLTSTLADAPAQVDADEPLAVSLRASQGAVHPSDAHSSLPGELALPSMQHGALDGFVVLGTKLNGETYRPDEREVLGDAVHKVGLEFRALRMEQLEREVAEQCARIRDLETRSASLN